MNTFNVGDIAFLAQDIIEPPNDEHPGILFGVKGEKVEILKVRSTMRFPYKVQGVTGVEPWYCASEADLMRSPPFKCF
jgi:hypothetical protein